MNKTNHGRVLLGGSVAALILFIVAGIVNGGILNQEFQTWSQSMGSLIHPLPQSTAMGIWALMALVQGIAGVWIYAAIRPRFGAGPKTALLAPLALWVPSKFVVALDFVTLGIFPSQILAGQVIGSLVAMVLGVLAGAKLYKE